MQSDLESSQAFVLRLTDSLVEIVEIVLRSEDEGYATANLLIALACAQIEQLVVSLDGKEFQAIVIEDVELLASSQVVLADLHLELRKVHAVQEIREVVREQLFHLLL